MTHLCARRWKRLAIAAADSPEHYLFLQHLPPTADMQDFVIFSRLEVMVGQLAGNSQSSPAMGHAPPGSRRAAMGSFYRKSWFLAGVPWGTTPLHPGSPSAGADTSSNSRGRVLKVTGIQNP